MRRGVAYAILGVSGLLIYLLYTLEGIVFLAFDENSADLISGSQLDDNSTRGKPMIPKIIHQTWKNETIPEKWRNAQSSCLELHPDYEYMLWTDEKAREFIKTEYPWFLKPFDAYKYPIQRADVIRYFVLYHFGGIYIDLDDGCQRSLDPLLQFPAWLRETTPVGISNDVMGATPRHSFFGLAITHLRNYHRDWLIPYATVMFSTGPMFLSLFFEDYKRMGLNVENGKVWIMTLNQYKKYDSSFFFYNPGSSWHEGDAPFVFWLSRHWLLFTILCTVAVLSVAYGVYFAFNRCSRRLRRNQQPYYFKLENDFVRTDTPYDC